MDAYKLEPLHYYTAPGVFWDAILKYSKLDSEHLINIDMHLFIEKAMRGGISMVSKRHTKANNPHSADYNPEKENKYIMHYDANNIYGWSMNQPLPYSCFKRLTKNDQKWQIQKGKGWILEVDLEYLK